MKPPHSADLVRQRLVILNKSSRKIEIEPCRFLINFRKPPTFVQVTLRRKKKNSHLNTCKPDSRIFYGNLSGKQAFLVFSHKPPPFITPRPIRLSRLGEPEAQPQLKSLAPAMNLVQSSNM